MNNVSDNLQHLLVPISKLVHLDKNPRMGSLEAIKASYETFGQTKPLIAIDNGNDTYTVVAGNHQLKVARDLLGWTEMAVSIEEWDEEKAIAFALADNRTSELGTNDEDLLYEMLLKVNEDSEYWDAMEWDDFEMALMESNYITGQEDHEDFSKGFTPPVLVADLPGLDGEDEGSDEEIEYHADSETTKDIVTHGATAVDRAGSKTTFQFTLTFESLEEQKEWYDFVRYLQAEKVEGATATQKVLNFIRDKK